MTDTFDTASNSLHEQAVNWVTRLHSSDCTDAERHDFEAWLERSEDHRTAHRQVEAFWQS